MVSRSQIRLLSVLAFLSIQTQATFLDGANLFAIRQVASSGTGATDATVPTATNPPATSRAPETTRAPTTAPAPTTERTNPPPPATSRAPDSPPAPQPTTAPNTGGAPTQPAANTDRTSPNAPQSTGVTSTSPTSTNVPNGSSGVSSQFTWTSIDTATITPTVNVLTIIQTISGSVMTSLSSSTDTSAYASATSAAAANNAALANNNNKKDDTMPIKTRNIIIGVVVGVGGAIIFGGLFIVAWRIWGRKKSNDDSDGLMGFRGGSGNGTSEMAGTGAPAANPFQSTLENYHNPARGNVNASSNF